MNTILSSSYYITVYVEFKTSTGTLGIGKTGATTTSVESLITAYFQVEFLIGSFDGIFIRFLFPISCTDVRVQIYNFL